MSQKQCPVGRLSRRQFLKGGGAGVCLFLLSSILGCARGDEAVEPPGDEAGPTLIGQRKGFMNPVRSPWFTELEGDRLRCELCPRKCELAEGERAPCRVRENREGKGYTLAYGNPALLQEDPIERKPFFHVLPGTRALSISTVGCNLECKFCEVWDMALEHPENVYAHDVPPERVIEFARDSNLRSVSYAFGEPVIFYEYMAEVAALAREAGMLNLMHTAAYIQPEPLEEILEMMDAVNVDLKGFDEEFYRQVAGGELTPVLDALKMMRDSGVHIEITNLLIPTLNDDIRKVEQMCEWIADELGTGIPLHFARFYPLYRLSELPRTPVSTLEKARETALRVGFEYVYLAKVVDHEGENTYCPGCGEMIIDRLGFVINDIYMEEGRCSYCGLEIPGRWT